jgi:pimeloyl-ACP methyl ester carboxylesterase
MNTNLLDLTDGRRLCWAEYGDGNGTPLFLFHGNPGSRLCWGAWPGLQSLCGARLIAPDRPGYGRTDFTPSALESWPSDIVELADHLGIEKFAVFGPSGGAPYALACAWKIPDRLTAVGVFGAVGPNAPEAIVGVHRSLKLLWRIARPLQPIVRLQMLLMARVAQRDPARLARNMRDLELREEDRAIFDRPEIVGMFAQDFPEAYRQNGIGSAYDATIPANWPIPLEDVHMKVRLWHAERDPLVGNMTLYLAEHLPNAELQRLPGEGHLWILDHLAEVLDSLLEHELRPG